MSDAVIRWKVFPGAESEWWSYIEDGQYYLGGDRHRSKAKAEQYARETATRIAAERGAQVEQMQDNPDA
jgi:hypothetical protein